MKLLGILGGYEVALFLNLKMVFFTQIAGFQMLTWESWSPVESSHVESTFCKLDQADNWRSKKWGDAKFWINS